MKNLILKRGKLFIALLILPVLFITSCSTDDDEGTAPVVVQLESRTYALGSVADPTISGEATFIRNSDNTTTIELELMGTPSGGQHPAHIHFNTAAESGDIALTLGTVNGDTGFSSVTTSEYTYAELLDFDGYINVHLDDSTLGLATIVAQGDIGQNELTGESTVYTLNEVDLPGASGTISFYERVNGEALATIELIGTPAGNLLPAHIHMGSVATSPGAIIYSFNEVDGTTGVSMSNVANLDGEATFFGYDDVLAVDGYVNVHSESDLAVLIAQGDIGIND